MGVQIETMTTIVAPVTADALPFTGDDRGIHMTWALWALAAGGTVLVIGTQGTESLVKMGHYEDISRSSVWKWLRD